jgi:hypothetical protein
VPGGKFAKLAKLVAGSCNVAITEEIKGKGEEEKQIIGTYERATL